MTKKKIGTGLAGLLLAAAVAFVATSAGAAQDPRPKTKASRDFPAVSADIKDGKAKKIKTERHTFAVWDGCEFVFPKADETDWQFDDGSVATVSDNPDPLPPKVKSCVERNPTEAEFRAGQAEADARNGGPAKGPNGVAPPTVPLPAHLSPPAP
jgi:hypothetical protein